MEETTNASTTPVRKRSKKRFAIYVFALLLTVSLATTLMLQRYHRASKLSYPNIAAFTAYYLPRKDAHVIIDATSLNYKSNILVYKATHVSSGKALTITEQKTPADFDTSTLKADKEFTIAGGKAYITDGQSRTTAALFTTDGTWVLINAPDPIGADEMKLVLESLTSLKQ